MIPIIKITRISNTEYSFKLSNRLGLRCVAEALTFDNPEPYAYSDKIQKFDKKRFSFKVGMYPTLERYVKKHSLDCETTDYKFELPNGVIIDDRMSGNYVHQRQAVKAFYKRRFGIIVVPTRGGKTFIASEILRIFLDTDVGNFLFCVDNTTLFNQAVGDIKGYFENYGGIEVGEIRAGCVDTSHRITVAMIQTIQSTFSKRCNDKKKKANLTKYFRELKFLCVDEVHDNCSDSKLKIYKKAKNLEYQLCLSATPYRANALVQNLKLMEWSGDAVYHITEDELKSRGVLSDYKVFMLLVDHHSLGIVDKDKGDYNSFRQELLYDNKFRDAVLLKVIEILDGYGLKTLLIFQSIEHGLEIERQTGIKFISGVTTDFEREQAKEDFLTKKGGFLSASGIFKKGVTLSSVQVMINVDGGLEDANTIQKKGRVLGTTDDKSRSLIIDFFDLFEHYFSEHSVTRMETYVAALGEDGVGVLDTNVPSWDRVLKKWVKEWFEEDIKYTE